MEISKCMGRMEEYGGYPCPVCGFKPADQQSPGYVLPMETILAGKYIVGRVLGHGGFGLTYIGWDIALERKVAIKEYYPVDQVILYRHGLCGRGDSKEESDAVWPHDMGTGKAYDSEHQHRCIFHAGSFRWLQSSGAVYTLVPDPNVFGRR